MSRRYGLPIVIAVVALAAVFFLLSATRTSAPASLKLLVGVPEAYPDYALAVRNAAQLAYDEASTAPVPRSVELVFVNNSDPQDPTNNSIEAQVVGQMLPDEGVVAYIGLYSSEEARQTILVANAALLPIISPAASWPGLTKAGFAVGEPGVYYPNGQRNFFRVVPADDVQAVAAARWLRYQDLREIFILASTTTYSMGLAGIFEANAADHGLNIVGQQLYDIDAVSDTEIEQLVQVMEQAQPQAVFFPVTWEGRSGQVLRAVRRALPNAVVLGADAIRQDTLPDDNDTLHNVYATNLVAPLQRLPSAADFLASYEARYGETPEDYQLPIYEAVQVMLYVIQQAETPTRQGVLRALRDMDSYNGAMGTWNFDSNGDTSLQTIAIARFEDKPGGTRGDVWRNVDILN